MDINKIISKLDLNKNQSKVYLTLLQMGSGSIQEVSKKSRIKRTSAYSILDGLIQKGLVVLSQKGAHREYVVENPKKIANIIDKKILDLEKDKEDFLEIIPELASIYNSKAKKTKIKYYEGVEGLKLLFEETLQLNKGEEILAYSSAESIHEYFQEYVPFYLSQRVKKRIAQRCIAENSPTARKHKENDQAELRITRLVDKDRYPFSNEINIFGNKIFIASYKDLLGVLIESEDIAKTQRAIFELAWIGAEKSGIMGE